MDSVVLSGEIKRIAKKFGFVDAGIIEPHRPEHYDVFNSWLADGHAGGMNYLGTQYALDCRENPAMLFPDCQSIIVVLARYSSPAFYTNGDLDNSSGKVAAYAWGEDYHLVLIEKLNQMAKELGGLTGRSVKNRAVTDSVPLLEREMAYDAGLGWIGKNSCLISPLHGSYTFIAELMTDIPLKAETSRVPDRCGTCRRCIDACPTHCILPNHTIAAERCLAYLTIEHRGHIPDEFRPAMNQWVFGCDICQMVCPWNRDVDDVCIDHLFLITDNVSGLNLINELSLTVEEFQSKYHRSPIHRAKWSGYLRNICLILGNQRYLPALGSLVNLMRSAPDATVRAAAAWAVGQLADSSCKGDLEDMLGHEQDQTVREEIARVLEFWR